MKKIYIHEKIDTATGEINPFWTKTFEDVDDLLDFMNEKKHFIAGVPISSSSTAYYTRIRAAELHDKE